MKKLLLLFSAILLSFAFIPVQHNAETSDDIGLQNFIPQGKVNFSEIESVKKSAINIDSEKELTFVDSNSLMLKYLTEKTRIKSNAAFNQNEYFKLVKLKGNLSYDIKKTAKTIEFRSSEAAIPNFNLNSEENSILLGEEVYSFSTKITIDHSENAFNSAWTGFAYTNGKSKVVLAKLDNNRFGILMDLPNKTPQVFIENELK
ncbi:hypothetical protein [Zunongwangia endophytica]|uniref:Uncharacterized protein n=1 Tax=Zunongwangia endophytica TaxID=1808945 RepID=A0ABV8HAN4_9FLAO|nr:hypothetical protein [Zunongwangia endophytica]MDN3595250.1 hypothetical protein [Zunongwangia endophytica]